ncbi:MAG: phosphopantetheine-binding protein [Planctomycetota bacterium]
MTAREEVIVIIDQLMSEQGRGRDCEMTDSILLRKDLGFDSLELAILTVRIEANFGVDVFADGIVSTLGELLARVPSAQDS